MVLVLLVLLLLLLLVLLGCKRCTRQMRCVALQEQLHLRSVAKKLQLSVQHRYSCLQAALLEQGIWIHASQCVVSHNQRALQEGAVKQNVTGMAEV